MIYVPLTAELPKSGYSSPKAYVVDTTQEPTISRNDYAAVEGGIDKAYRRRRGDTIRASDFAPAPRTSLLLPPAPLPTETDIETTEPSPCEIEAEIKFAVPKRTRSGTVTQLNASAQAQGGGTMAVSVGSKQTVKPKPRTRSAKAKSAHMESVNPQETMIMKIDDDPLPPQASDEEDDPLLLTGQVWVDPSGNSFCECFSWRIFLVLKFSLHRMVYCWECSWWSSHTECSPNAVGLTRVDVGWLRSVAFEDFVSMLSSTCSSRSSSQHVSTPLGRVL